MKTLSISFAVLLTGCSTTTTLPTQSLNYEQPTYVRNAQGQTIYKIQGGSIYSTQGPTAGQRVGRIK